MALLEDTLANLEDQDIENEYELCNLRHDDEELYRLRMLDDEVAKLLKQLDDVKYMRMPAESAKELKKVKAVTNKLSSEYK